MGEYITSAIQLYSLCQRVKRKVMDRLFVHILTIT